jgi:FkbM family methyltransferase
MPLVLKGCLLLAAVMLMLLWNPPAGMYSYSGCEDLKNAKVPPTDGALNARLPAFKTMPESVENALAMILKERSGNRATFVQIGANDGEMFDPLYPHTKTNKSQWIALQVEPQPDLYSKLAVLHADAPDWAFYHGALASPELCVNGTLPFCETKTPGVGDWTTQGQLNSVEHKGCNLDTMQIRLRPCVSSFEDLIGNHASPVFLKHALDKSNKFNVDFLQIDVEGKDYDVLKLIDWDTLYPQCIHYEYVHLHQNGPKAIELLTEKNYTMITGSMDVLACQIEAKETSR